MRVETISCSFQNFYFLQISLNQKKLVNDNNNKKKQCEYLRDDSIKG